MKQALFGVSLAATLMCAAAPPMETTIKLAVPKEIAAPVLMLDAVEVKEGERMTIEVLGPADPKTRTRPLLAVAGIVGSNQARADAPTHTMDLVVPLNDKAKRLVADQDEVTLTIRLRRGKHALKFKRAYLRER